MKPIVGKAYRVSRGFSVALTAHGHITFVEHQTLPAGEPVELLPGWDAHAPSGYDTMSQAISRLDSLVYQGYDIGPKDFHVIIPLIGHLSAYLHTDEADGSRAAYWAAAQASTPHMAVIEEQLADPDGIHDWALRLGAMYGRPLSSNERVELCASSQPDMREFGMTVTTPVEDASEPPTAGSGSRRRT